MIREPSLRKAAVLIASLDVDTADLLLAQMPGDQAELVRREMDDLNEIDAREQRAVLDEFFRFNPLSADADRAEPDRDSQLPSQPRDIDDLDVAGYVGQPYPTAPPFSSLAKAPLETIATILEHEHPQAVALVLAHLSPDRASQVLARLPASVQAEVVRRLMDCSATDPRVLVELELAITSRLHSHGSLGKPPSGLVALKAILQASKPAARRQILSNLAAHDRHLVSQVVPPVPTKRFTFSEVCGLPLESLTCLIQAADRRTAVLALAGMPAELVDELLECLDSQRADWFARRLINLGPLCLADIDRAQEDLAVLAGQLLAECRLEGYSIAHLTAVA
jgi:flagellar motor switch protein FliG